MLDIDSRKHVGLTSRSNETRLEVKGMGLWCNGTPKHTIRFRSVLRCLYRSYFRCCKVMQVKNMVVQGCMEVLTSVNDQLQLKNEEIQHLSEELMSRRRVLAQLENISPSFRTITLPIGSGSDYFCIIFGNRSLSLKFRPHTVVRNMTVETRDPRQEDWTTVFRKRAWCSTFRRSRLWIPRRWHKPNRSGSVRIKVDDIFFVNF